MSRSMNLKYSVKYIDENVLVFHPPIDVVASPVVPVTSTARYTNLIRMTFSPGKRRYDMTRPQDVFWIHKSKCILGSHWWETDGVQSKVSPSDIMKPPDPQKFETSRLIIYHALPGINHIGVVYPKHASVHERMIGLGIGFHISLRQHHYIAMGGTGVYHILSSSNVVSRVIKSGQLMSVNSIIL